MTEPSYEELKARVAELEKKSQRRTGELDFKIGEKGGVSVTASAGFQSHCITNSGSSCSKPDPGSANFSKRTRAA
jgi:hypothetical protein